MALLGLAVCALFAIQLYLCDLLMRDPRKIIWVRRQTTRWQQMVRDLDFACELWEIQGGMQ